MRLVGRLKLTEFVESHADARSWLHAWVAETEEAAWQTPQGIKDCYRSASFLPNNTLVFNVKGNRYRSVCKIAYKMRVITIPRIGTYAEYSKKYCLEDDG
jgi:mRNA interferase HigB